MLILTRRVGETLMIGDEVTVTVLGKRQPVYWCERPQRGFGSP